MPIGNRRVALSVCPDYATFERSYQEGCNQVVYSPLVADLDTPVSIIVKLTNAGIYSFALESVTGGEVRGRYSIIGADPDVIWECRGDRARMGLLAGGEIEWREEPDAPFASLRRLLADSSIDLPKALPPSCAGLFGYLGYDMIRLIERLPDGNRDTIGCPDACLLRPQIIAVLDGVRSEVTIVSPAWHQPSLTPREAYALAAERVRSTIDKLEQRSVQSPRRLGRAAATIPFRATTNRQDFIDQVTRAKQHIAKGDAFQIVLSQRWRCEYGASELAFYRALRRTNPSPFMFFFNFGSFHVIGASPEILVRLSGREVTIRPIAGTRPRGATVTEDRALAEELLADPKERAEHLMLLDLGRNDVGKVSRIGSVSPTESFAVERYSHVMHIASNVVGELREGEDALSALLSGLPAGTVSGAPKIRAMEIIDDLETERRGVYAGGIGYFSVGGDMDMCIALRTAIIKDGELIVQAGAGIVHDSVPEAEWEEAITKTMALRRAAELALQFDDHASSPALPDRDDLSPR